jgi:hypothetical protein
MTNLNASKVSSLLNGVYNSVEYKGGLWSVYSISVVRNTNTFLVGFQSLGEAWQYASEGGRYVLFSYK